MRAMKTLVAFVLVMAAACGGNKSQQPTAVTNAEPVPAATNQADAATELELDLEKICYSYERSGAKPSTGLTEVGPWLEKHVRSAEGKALLEQLKNGSFEQTREEAKRHNVAPCPLLDSNGQQARS
jgi:hypothetical protein